MLSACGPVHTDVATAQVALDTTERLGLRYLGLPRCGFTREVPCSSKAKVAELKVLDYDAFWAVAAASRNAGLTAAAWMAISEFEAEIPR